MIMLNLLGHEDLVFSKNSCSENELQIIQLLDLTWMFIFLVGHFGAEEQSRTMFSEVIPWQ